MRTGRWLACFVLAACALSAIAQQTEQEGSGAPKPPGKLVDLGGYRLHLSCTGSGSPTVVLSAGAGDYSVDWALVQSRVQRFARVCSYDRAGDAWSDPGPVPRTMRQEAYELHLALAKAGEHGPYVLVGHSMGGLVMRLFAEAFPSDVAGLVLVDATSEDAVLSVRGKPVRVRLTAKDRPVPDVQTLKSGPPVPATEGDRKEFEDFLRQFGAPQIEPPYNHLPPEAQKLDLWARSQPPRTRPGDDYMAEEMQGIYERSQKAPNLLGDKPLFVLIAGRREGRPPNISPEEWQRMSDEKVEQKRRFGLLSTNSKVEVDEQAGHHIQLDDPDAVVGAIRATRVAAQHHARIAP